MNRESTSKWISQNHPSVKTVFDRKEREKNKPKQPSRKQLRLNRKELKRNLTAQKYINLYHIRDNWTCNPVEINTHKEPDALPITPIVIQPIRLNLTYTGRTDTRKSDMRKLRLPNRIITVNTSAKMLKVYD